MNTTHSPTCPQAASSAHVHTHFPHPRPQYPCSKNLKFELSPARFNILYLTLKLLKKDRTTIFAGFWWKLRKIGKQLKPSISSHPAAEKLIRIYIRQSFFLSNFYQSAFWKWPYLLRLFKVLHCIAQVQTPVRDLYIIKLCMRLLSKNITRG